MTPEEKKNILQIIALKEVLNAKEVAVLTGKCVCEVYAKAREGVIPYFKPDGQGHIYFDKAKIIAWMRGEWKPDCN